MWPGGSASATAPAVGGLFSPQDRALGLDRSGLSPRVQQKVVHAGVNSSSYEQAARDLAALGDLELGPKRVAAVAAFRERPLLEQDTVAESGRPCPAVAMVSSDGGRLQIRAPAAAAAEPDSGRCGHWRESKVAVLETYHSTVSRADPDPGVPRCFLDLARTAQLVRGLGHALPAGLEVEGAGPEAADEPAGTDGGRAARPGRPQRLVRSVLA